MPTIKDLVPTIFDAINAIEQGCRKIQDDPLFTPAMSAWMKITSQDCLGCLATSTIMQLTHKSAKYFLDHFSTEELPTNISRAERSASYELEADIENGSYSALVDFEFSIDFFRSGDLKPLLVFYGLHQHQYFNEAAKWYSEEGVRVFDATCTKEVLANYAEFLKTTFLPKLECWFK